MTMQPSSTATDPGNGPEPTDAPITLTTGDRSLSKRPGGSTWAVILLMGAVSGIFCWLFWSVFMSIAMGQDLVRILIGPGAGFGLTMGVVFCGLMAFLMRPTTIVITVGKGDDFASRLDGEMAKLRYQPLEPEEGMRVFGPKTLFRPHAFDILVRLENGKMTVTGPSTNVKALKKRFKA
jgi:hypothetical protein